MVVIMRPVEVIPRKELTMEDAIIMEVEDMGSIEVMVSVVEGKKGVDQP